MISGFIDLEVWQKAHQLFLDAVKDSDKFPKTDAARIITNQLLRSTGSISANIAEGYNAQSTKEYLHYLDVSIRTCAESENWIYKLKDLKYLSAEIVDRRLSVCLTIKKMLFGLKRSLKNKPHKPIPQ